MVMNSNKQKILIFGGVLALLIFGGKKVYDMTRGLRNNNPGNIRLSNTQWLGQVAAIEQSDPAFTQFTDPVYGIRAMAKVLKSYSARGINTLAAITSTWAPPTENDTAEYVKFLSDYTGLAPDAVVTSASYPSLIAGIIAHENGVQPYSTDVLQRGIAMA